MVYWKSWGSQSLILNTLQQPIEGLVCILPLIIVVSLRRTRWNLFFEERCKVLPFNAVPFLSSSQLRQEILYLTGYDSSIVMTWYLRPLLRGLYSSHISVTLGCWRVPEHWKSPVVVEQLTMIDVSWSWQYKICQEELTMAKLQNGNYNHKQYHIKDATLINMNLEM